MMNELKLPEQQDIPTGSPRGKTDSTCDICNVTLCDDRNLYIHKFLNHGKKNKLAILQVVPTPSVDALCFSGSVIECRSMVPLENWSHDPFPSVTIELHWMALVLPMTKTLNATVPRLTLGEGTPLHSKWLILFDFTQNYSQSKSCLVKAGDMFTIPLPQKIIENCFKMTVLIFSYFGLQE